MEQKNLKKLTIFVLVGLMVFSIIGSFALATFVYGSTLFADDFEDSGTSDLIIFTTGGSWEVKTGDWEMYGGEYQYGLGGISSIDGTTYVEGPNWSDFFIEADMKLISGSPQVNILTRVANDTRNLTEQWLSYYSFQHRVDGKWVVNRWAGNYQTVLAISEGSMPLNYNQTYSIKMEVFDQSIKGYVDGVLVVEANDVSDDRLSHGTIGFQADECNVAFDNVVVQEITDVLERPPKPPKKWIRLW